MKTKQTSELEPGDVVLWGCQRDKILSIKKGLAVWTFNVERTFTDERAGPPAEERWHAGSAVYHNVEGEVEEVGFVDLSEEGKLVVSFMLKEMSGMSYIYSRYAYSAYETALSHYGYRVAPEGRDVIVSVLMRKMKAIDGQDCPECEAEVT